MSNRQNFIPQFDVSKFDVNKDNNFSKIFSAKIQKYQITNRKKPQDTNFYQLIFTKEYINLLEKNPYRQDHYKLDLTNHQLFLNNEMVLSEEVMKQFENKLTHIFNEAKANNACLYEEGS